MILTDERVVTVEGYGQNHLAVHRNVRKENGDEYVWVMGKKRVGRVWVITAKNVNLFVAWFTERDVAMQFAHQLNLRFNDAFAQRNSEAMLRRLPSWAKAWCILCRRKNKIVSPQPLIDKANRIKR